MLLRKKGLKSILYDFHYHLGGNEINVFKYEVVYV